MNVFNLPVDIPWRRLSVSEDMYARNLSANLPAKWRSSLAIFHYEPKRDEEEQEEEEAEPDEITSFLKVVATITGYQPEGAEVDEGAIEGPFHAKVIENFETLTGQYYPAYSALLQVAVFPQIGEECELADYPYLTDFEPKKRELVELVSETGEALTQSSSDLRVRKGTTSTDSTEVVDIDRGSSFGVSVSTPKYGGALQAGQQQESGTRGVLGTQAMSLVTTDASRERRELYSHTTNLSQLYHLLDSYHAGMNRAIFFVNARPHILDSPYTFAPGPRRLEGIQEFFLVVRRPRKMKDFCVKAVLETAHLHETEVQVTTGKTRYDEGQLSQTFTLQAQGGGDFHGSDDKAGQWTMQIPGGYKLDRSKGDGTFHVEWNDAGPKDYVIPAGVSIDDWSAQTSSGNQEEAFPQITAYDDHIDIRAHIYGWFGVGDTDGKLKCTITVYYISIQPVEAPTTTKRQELDLFITAREVSGCTGRPGTSFAAFTGTYLAYEKQVAGGFALMKSAKIGGKEALVAANELGRRVRDEVTNSFREGRRYSPGEFDFLHARFAIRALLAGVEPQAEQYMTAELTQVKALPETLRTRLESSGIRVSAGKALRMSPEELAENTGLSSHEARRVFTALLGVRRGVRHVTPGQAEPQTRSGDKGRPKRTKQ